MKRITYWLRSTFGFSQTEANGITVLIPLVFLIVLSSYYYEYYIINYNYPITGTPFVTEIHLKLKQKEEKEKETRDNRRKTSGYIKYETKRTDRIKSVYKRSGKKNTDRFKKKMPYVLPAFDINTADTTQLKRVKGIGKVLSARIVKYRDLLGGFVSKAQLKEVYGLKDSVLISLDTLIFIDDGFQPTVIAVNSASEYSLRKHPYISYSEAKAIAAYVFQHGRLHYPDDLLKIHVFDSAKVRRIQPYLHFDGTEH